MLKRISFTHIATGVLLLVIVALVYADWREDREIEKLLESLQNPKTPVASPETVQSLPDPVKTHSAQIKRIETDARMTLSRVAKLIIRDEGERSRPYLDPSGKVTIGIGRNLESNGISVAELHAVVNEIDYNVVLTQTHVAKGRILITSLPLAEKIFTESLTEHDIQLLLTDDLNNVRKEAERVFGETWQRLDSVRKEVIIDVLFNIGLPHFKQFHKFIAAVKAGDWDVAASELLLSNAARQNIVRYHRNATVLRTGDAQYFNLN